MKDTQKAGVLAIVRRMIARTTENKAIGWNVETNVLHNRSIGSSDCYPLVQEIAPIDSAVGGTAQQRMGDRIKPKSLTVRGLVCLNPATSDTSVPIYVRVVIAAQKNLKVGSQVAGGGVAASSFLRPALAGTGNDQLAFDGSTQALAYPVNRDLFRVYYDKIHKMTLQNAGVPSVDGTPNPGFTYRWSYTFKKLPSTFSYDESNGDWANNFAPFVATGYSFADGTQEAGTTTRIQQTVFSLLEFEDA